MTPLIIYFSGRFLTKHPVNKNLISLKPKIIGSCIWGCLLYSRRPTVWCPTFPHL